MANLHRKQQQQQQRRTILSPRALVTWIKINKQTNPQITLLHTQEKLSEYETYTYMHRCQMTAKKCTPDRVLKL